ncbi:MAG: hypothetical protein DYH13_02065 [Alphaproteobacteria bacterium PRO2]|nr:hypothetical protein [Alphaproteobacteria bacterium PRO2]
MADEVQTHFADSSSGDEEADVMKHLAKLVPALKVLERYAHHDVKGASIRKTFDYLSFRARLQPLVKHNATTGALEFKTGGEEQHEKTMSNMQIHEEYNRWNSMASDSFSEVLIPNLIDSYSAYPEVVGAFETIKDSLAHEKAIKQFYRNNFSPYQIALFKEDFKQKCLGEQKPGNAAGLTKEI